MHGTATDIMADGSVWCVLLCLAMWKYVLTGRVRSHVEAYNLHSAKQRRKMIGV